MDQPTPRQHELDVYPKAFASIVDGSQPFLIWAADHGIEVDDLLELKEWNPETGNHTGNVFSTMATCIEYDPRALQPGYVTIGLFYPPSVPRLTGRQVQELVLNCLSVAIQGAKSEYHMACGEIVIFYLPYVAGELNEDPATLLQQYIQKIRAQQAKAGLLSLPFDKSFYSHCLEAWSQ